MLMRNIFIAGLLTITGCMISPVQVMGGTPVVGELRQSLSPYWKFRIDPYQQGEARGWHRSSHSVAGWDSMAVPGNWDLSNEYANYKGKAWYRTAFRTAAAAGKRVILSFGEVGNAYRLFLNDKLIASVDCGNYPEEFDITSMVRQGQENRLAVEVDNSLTYGAYWGWGGIRRPVEIRYRPAFHVLHQAVTPELNLSRNSARVRTSVTLRNASAAAGRMVLQQEIFYQNRRVAITSRTIDLPASSYPVVMLELELDSAQVKLWHFDHPELYTSRITLKSEARDMYVIEDRFGLRKIELVGHQFRLNGEPVRLAGFNWVADDRVTGSTLPAYRFREDIDLMKQAGANMARLSHRPLPSDVMDYLDEKGMLVISEFNIWPPFMNDRTPEGRRYATKLIQQQYNHPSIVGWSIGNENGFLREHPEVNEYTSSLIRFIKDQLDSVRLVTYVSHSSDNQDNDPAQFGDLILINKYGGFVPSVNALNKRYPGRPAFMTEYGQSGVNLKNETPNRSVFQRMMVDGLKQQEQVFGYSIWTFNDYRSNYQTPDPVTTTPVHQNRPWGVVDVHRNLKRSYGQIRKFFAPVTDLQVNNAGDSARVIIQPRGRNDIPSFTLDGYRLKVECRKDAQSVYPVQDLLLPRIVPGDGHLTRIVSGLASDARWYRFSLVSPTGYRVLDTTIHLQVPAKPSGVKVIEADQGVRFVFDRTDDAREYVLHYETGGLVKQVAPTIDHYAEISGLAIGSTYRIWLTGVNERGQGPASDTFSFTSRAGYTGLPPVIWQVEGADGRLFLAPSYQPQDQQYELRCAPVLDPVKKWQHITSTNFGMISMPGLENGKSYMVQIRRRTGYNSNWSVWSEPRVVEVGKPSVIDRVNWSERAAPLEAGHMLKDSAYNIWCGSVVQGEDRRYYMVYSRWPRAKGHEAWITHSELALAVSDDAAGPYQHLKVILPSRGPRFWDGICTHNPAIYRHKNKYYLVYMGATGPRPEKPVAPYSREWYVYRNSQRIGVAVADRPEGPWARFDRPILAPEPDTTSPDAVMVSNPALTFNDRDEVVLVYKQVAYNGNFRGGRVRFGVAFAPTVLGPYKKHPRSIFESTDPAVKGEWMLAEDPFIWFQEGRYHAVVRDVTGRFTGDKGLALFTSTNAIDWAPTSKPRFLDRQIYSQGGTPLGDKLERPWLLFSEGIPKYLFGSMGIDGRRHSMNISLEIK
jgi:beta-galactosidase